FQGLAARDAGLQHLRIVERGPHPFARGGELLLTRHRHRHRPVSLVAVATANRRLFDPCKGRFSGLAILPTGIGARPPAGSNATARIDGRPMTNPHPADASLSSQLSTPLYGSAAMRAIMTDRARLQRMLDFEAALAQAEAAVGVIA